MRNDDLHDLLVGGYDQHVSELRSGEDFAQRHHARVAGRVRRRRTVRAVATSTGALASLVALGVGAHALVEHVRALPPAVSPSPSVSPSPAPSPSPSPSDGRESGPNGYVLDPLPAGPPSGVIVENSILRLVLDAQAPGTSGTSNGSVTCGAPVSGEYLDPVFDEATARILRPDTLYPTVLDPDFEWVPNSAFNSVSWFVADGVYTTQEDIDSWIEPVGSFFVSVSYRSEAIQSVEVDDPFVEGRTWLAEFSMDWNVIARQGDLSEAWTFNDFEDDVDLAFGTVLVQDGVIVGHANLFSNGDGTWGDPIDPSTALWGVGDLTVTDGKALAVYDFGTGPLEHVLWCDGQASGPVDAYAVIGSRTNNNQDLVYSFIWAGQVEYK